MSYRAKTLLGRKANQSEVQDELANLDLRPGNIEPLPNRRAEVEREYELTRLRSENSRLETQLALVRTQLEAARHCAARDQRFQRAATEVTGYLAAVLIAVTVIAVIALKW